MKRIIMALLLGGLIGLTPVWAEQPDYDDEAGSVVIRPGDQGELYYEYRVNGQIKEIRVVPKIGKPYYLVPAEGGDGKYIRQDNSQLLIPSWVLFRW